MRAIIALGLALAAYFSIAGHPEGWSLLVRVCCGVSFVLLALGVWGRREKGRGVILKSEQAEGWADFAMKLIGLLGLGALLVLVFWKIPPWAKAQAENVGGWFTNGTEASEQAPRSGDRSDPDASREADRGNWLWDENGVRPLASEGVVEPSERPEIYLYPETQEDLGLLRTKRPYLRAFTLNYFSNDVWSDRGFQPRTLRASEGIISLQNPPPNDSQRPSGESISYQVVHGSQPGESNLLVAAPGLQTVQLPYLREVAPSTYRLPVPPGGAKGFRYGLVSRPVYFEDLVALGLTLEVGKTELVSEIFLSLPDDSPVVSELKKIGEGFEGSVIEKLGQIRDYLWLNYAYSLDLGQRGSGGALSDFLLAEKRGHCEHFSTAATLLARSVGIPARMAYGWSGGYFFPEQEVVVFREREAHAWAELFFEDYGWVIFDATPPNREEGQAGFAGAEEGPPQNPLEERDHSTSETQTLWGIGVGALIVAGFWLILRRPENAEKRGHRTDREERGLLYVQDLENFGGDRGVPRRRGETVRAFLSRLEESEGSIDFGEKLISYHYGWAYEGGRRRPGEERALRREIREAKKS